MYQLLSDKLESMEIKTPSGFNDKPLDVSKWYIEHFLILGATNVWSKCFVNFVLKMIFYFRDKWFNCSNNKIVFNIILFPRSHIYVSFILIYFFYLLNLDKILRAVVCPAYEIAILFFLSFEKWRTFKVSIIFKHFFLS